MLIPCAVCNTTNKLLGMPNYTTPQMCRECGHHFTTEYVTQCVLKTKLSIQQEADIDQAANEWMKDLEEVCTNPLRFIPAFVREVVTKAMTGAVAEIAAENNLLLIEKSDHIRDIKEIREALEQIDPLLKAFGAADTREIERTTKIINAARDKYPL